MNQIPVKQSPIANWSKYWTQWFPIRGIQFKEAISIAPPENIPTIPTRYIVVEIVAASSACTTNSTGEINKNVNSIGSVTPHKIAVNVIGISNANTFFLFSGFAVA